MSDTIIATAVVCPEGRIRIMAANWLRTHYKVTSVDAVTVDGADKVLGEGPDKAVEAIHRKVKHSVAVNKPILVVVVGHHGCKANPGLRQDHLRQIRLAMKRVESWKLPVRIIGLWITSLGKIEAVKE